MGEYPDNLEALIKIKYITKLPSEPYSDEIMRYKKVDNDFLLYSVGADFTDNRGVRSEGSDVAQWEAEDADRLFWPVK